jgi:Ca2+-binding RTX toxin-like protein
MINIQATKAQTSETGPKREDYEEKEDRRRRFVPLIFLLIVGSCVAYLKSFLPAKLAENADHPSPHSSDTEEQAIKEDAVADFDAEPGDVELAAKSSGRTEPVRISARPDEEGVVLGSGDIIGQARTPQPKIAGFDGETPRGAGDKRSSDRPDAPSGGRGGGGGGGGGGDKPNNPRDPRDPPNPTPDLRNRAPRLSGPVHLADVAGCQALTITIMALLAGATDPDGDHLTVVGLSSSSGTLTRTEDGGWEFEHDRGMRGEVTLTYAVSDGSHFVVQTAFFNVIEAPPIVGTEGDDNLLGTKCADTIIALGGNDNIDAREGNDKIFGGDGDDHILAGTGDDVVYAGAGDDIVFAGAGNDIVFGGAGNDRLFGEAGNDTLYGEDGNDHLEGGAGRDILLAGSGNDLLQGDEDDDTLDGGEGDDKMAGGTGNDVMTGGAGDDVMTGNAGNDTMADETGSDTVRGGEGDDHVLASADATDDTFEGGIGIDTLNYSSAVRSIAVDLGSGQAVGEDIGHDTVSEFENIVGGSGDDALKAVATGSSIDGGAGNDVLTGSAGDDFLAGSSGNDTISDGAGSDVVKGGEGDDHVVASADAADDNLAGGAGRDELDYSATTHAITVDIGTGRAEGEDIGHDTIAEFEAVVSGAGDDYLTAGATAASIDGGCGNDVVSGGAGDDVLKGNDGNDIIADGAGSDVVKGGDGNDRVVASVDAASDNYEGNAGCDTLDYSAATLTVTIDLRNGTAEGIEVGEDLIAGFEEIIAGSGDDRIVAGDASVTMTGGAGNDIFEFQRGSNEGPGHDLVRKITDFTIGDRIVTASYQIVLGDDDDSVEHQVEDLFEQVYKDEENSGHGRAVRFRFEDHSDGQYTAIDVADRADPEDIITIEISGHQQLQFAAIHS